jgi:hypothetical protein
MVIGERYLMIGKLFQADMMLVLGVVVAAMFQVDGARTNPQGVRCSFGLHLISGTKKLTSNITRCLLNTFQTNVGRLGCILYRMC